MKEAVDNNKIIHLYLLNKCTHHCKLCCNKQYDVDKIPVVTVEELKYADTLCLTGGEPFMLDGICDFAEKIKLQYPNIQYIYVYTCGDSLLKWLGSHKLHHIDGVNISPKNRYDAECVNELFKYHKDDIVSLWSNRLYLFPNVRDLVSTYDIRYESVNIIFREWQEEFKASSGIFRRLPILMD